jgi:hypothetical protein
MVSRNNWKVLGAGVLMGTLGVWSSLAGCQSDSNPGATSSGTGGGGAGDVTSAGGGSTTGSATGGGSTTTTTSTTTTGSGGGAPSCAGQDATIADITGNPKSNNPIGPGQKVKVTGVVAMSHKFLVSQSTSGSCLWGVYVSAPGLAETEEYSGILALSYGTNATIPDGGNQAYCPILGKVPAGDKIPDDTKPGDVLDLVGTTDYFVLKNCASEPGGTSAPQRQLAKVCSAVKTGTAPMPAPHVMAPADIPSLSAPADKVFHDKWGGVKVQLNDVTAVPQNPGDGGAPAIVGQYGKITLEQGNLTVGDNVYYVGALKKDACYSGPQFSSPDFVSIAGFSSIDFCTWTLQPNDKCTDFNPASEDCTPGQTCP